MPFRLENGADQPQFKYWELMFQLKRMVLQYVQPIR